MCYCYCLSFCHVYWQWGGVCYIVSVYWQCCDFWYIESVVVFVILTVLWCLLYWQCGGVCYIDSVVVFVILTVWWLLFVNISCVSLVAGCCRLVAVSLLSSHLRGRSRLTLVEQKPERRVSRRERDVIRPCPPPPLRVSVPAASTEVRQIFPW